MDKCIVCLVPINNILPGISSKSEEWQEYSIQSIIEKHLWWWSLKQSSSFHWICRICWSELLSFNKFFTRVENAHRQYELLNVEQVSTVIEGPDINANPIVPKQEFQIIDEILPVSTDKWTQKDDTIQISRKDDEIKPELLKAPDYDNLDVDTNDENWLKNTDPISEEIESKANIELFEIKEEFDASENTSTANNIDVNNLGTSKTRHKKKSIEAVKEPEFSYTNNNDVQCTEAGGSDLHNKLKEVDINPTKKRKRKLKNNRKQRKIENCRANNEYLNKSGYKFFCHLCKIQLSDFRNLSSHYRSEHGIVGAAVCCNKKFYNRATLVDHLRVHEDPNYFKCQVCGKILSNRISYETHLAYHKLPTNGLNPVYSCSKCDTIFLKKAAYTRHSFLHVPAEERKFQCDECDKKFGAEHLLKLHKTFTHLKKYCKICEICGKSFRERFSFKRHMDEHNGKPSTKIPCDICGIELTNKYLLNRHKKLRHTEEFAQEQICSHCGKVSPNLAAHRQHVFYNHTLEPKHACHICDKKFKLALKLKEHLSTHTGEPLFTCSFCSQTFISKTRMYRHRKDAHPKEWLEMKQKSAVTPKLKGLAMKEPVNTNFSEVSDVKYEDINKS